MAIVWGSVVTGGTGAMKLGYEVFRNGSTLTVDYYFHAQLAISDTSNVFYAELDGMTMYNGPVSIYTENSSWGDKNIIKLATYSTSAAGIISIYASIRGIDTLGAGLTAEVSASVANYTELTNGTVSVTDRGDNNIVINGYSGGNGTNNAVNKATLFWRFNNASWSSSDVTYSANTYYSKVVSIPSGATSVEVDLYTYGQITTNKVSSTKVVKYYGNPGAPGKPVLSLSNPKGPKLEEDFYFSWMPGTAGTNVPVSGYQLTAYKNGVALRGIDLESMLSTDLDVYSTSHVIEYGRSGTFNFKKGDTIQLGIFSFGYDGAGNPRFNGGKATTSQVLSDVYTFVGSGVLRINVGGVWKEGQVYVNVNGVWKEADSVYINSNGSWKEST